MKQRKVHLPRSRGKGGTGRTRLLGVGACGLILGAVLAGAAWPAVSSPIVLGQTTLPLSLSSSSLSPVVAILAGILILILPRLLNYVVAVYLILNGLIGLFGR